MTPARFACLARGLLLRPSSASGALCVPLEECVVEHGAFDAPAPAGPFPSVGRATGGAPSLGGAGVVALAWRVPRDPMVTPEKLLNLACRPLLQWLKSLRIPAAYLGRDALSVPDGEIVRLGLTGNTEAFLLEARVAFSSTLDVPGMPTAVWRKPGDRKPGRTLASLSRQVPSDGDTLAATLLAALAQTGVKVLLPGDVEGVAAPATADADGLAPGVASALGLVRADARGRLVGPFMGSVSLVVDVAAGVVSHGDPGRAVRDALALPGAFLLGADAEHLVAALQEARGG